MDETSCIKSVDIVCPVFREGTSIASFHQQLSSVLDRVSERYIFQIHYVLDPWPDQTEAELRRIAANDKRVAVLVMSRKFGHQASLVAGLDHCNADAVVMMDSDLQHPPELIPSFLQAWENGAEVVQAVRGAGNETSLIGRYGARLFYSLFGNVAEVDLKRGAADFRLLTRRVADVFKQRLHERNPFLRGLVAWIGYQTAYIPFMPAKRRAGRTKYSLVARFSLGLTGICSFSKEPLRWCMAIGALLAAVAFMVGVLQLAAYFAGTLSVPGWASLFTAVTFLGGVQIFFLGVLGEYLGIVFDEVKARPRYLVSHTYGSEPDVKAPRALIINSDVREQ